MINKDRLVNNLIEMIKIDSPSYEEKDYREYLIKYFQDRDFEVYTDNAGEKFGGNCGNLLVHIKGSNSNEEAICLAAHMDTVSPGKGIEPTVENGIMKSKGNTILAGDDKAGIASILEAVEHIKEEKLPHRDIYLLFTVCEEVGMLGAKNFDVSKLPCKNVVIIDAAGPAGIIAYAAPAKDDIKATFIGRTAHAGIEPEKGINAIYMAAEAISNMTLGRLDEETTANIGRIEGGSQTNIVTDKVSFTAEARSHSIEKLDTQVEHIKNACEAAAQKFGGTVEIKVSRDYPTLKLDKDSFIFSLCKESFEKENINPSPLVIGGGSDANIFAGKGYDCAIISVGMGQVHTVGETLNIDDMYTTTKVLAQMISL
ncbi:M20/M25/M40 family metallo-hydrolase [Brassicibacter mesophilus]|uniref:M20/M25/M40 family metallo-hydrolase n=1 Tax=Brassicibacter mesophilus TaxID=745119 RepID=UPI003D1B5B0A